MDKPTLIADSDWQPLSHREPPSSGVYAVQTENGTHLFAVYQARSRSWCKPQRDLRLFDATTPEMKATRHIHCFHTWRELSPRELAKLSPVAQAWAAGFLPAGEAIPFVPN
jgi:hypothetical protein